LLPGFAGLVPCLRAISKTFILFPEFGLTFMVIGEAESLMYPMNE
jgi:hypothetical protein